MAIPDEDIARVRAATDLALLVGEHTALKRVGRRLVGLCPFHAERSPSFSVNAEEGLYYCFGCQASGDAISFVRAMEGCDFVEAVERLAGRAGITVRDDADPAAAEERGRRRELLDVIAAAAAFYHERLLAHPEAARARQYLRSRGYDGEVVRRFGIGYAPETGAALVRGLGRPASLLKSAGLAYERGGGQLQDVFRDRVIFPIYDPAGRPVALGGRVLPEELRRTGSGRTESGRTGSGRTGSGRAGSGRTVHEAGPKYRNSPESPIYQKRRTLYGLNWAKGEIARSGEAVICEGYTDVIGFHTAGVATAVATCGTSLTEDHLRLLGRFARRIVLAFDADRAGENAAARLYEWERRHELELRVADLPPGNDPADLARKDPSALAAAIAAARPFLAFRVERAIEAADLATPEGRARAAASALAVVAEHPNDLVRDEYLLVVAGRTRQDPDRLRPLLAAAVERARTAAVERSSRPGPPARSSRPTPPARSSPPTPSAPDDAPPLVDDGRYDDDLTFDDDLPPAPRPAPGHGSTPPGRGPQAAGATRRHRAFGEGPRPGRNALLLAIHRPGEVAELLEDACFVDPVQRAAFEALGRADRLSEAIERAEPEAAELLARLANSDGADELDVAGTVLAVVRQAAEAALKALQAEARVAQRSAGDASVEETDELRNQLATGSWLSATLERLRMLEAVHGGAADALCEAERLLAWLSQRQS